jgi:hypothetical protein
MDMNWMELSWEEFCKIHDDHQKQLRAQEKLEARQAAMKRKNYRIRFYDIMETNQELFANTLPEEFSIGAVKLA